MLRCIFMSLPYLRVSFVYFFSQEKAERSVDILLRSFLLSAIVFEADGLSELSFSNPSLSWRSKMEGKKKLVHVLCAPRQFPEQRKFASLPVSYNCFQQ